jgi:glutamate/tyrosine decarboxylase-like PLP-dependent enzyme
MINCPADQSSITLNFSRGAANVVAQYYQLLRLGREGYTAVMSNLATIARRLADGIMETGAQCLHCTRVHIALLLLLLLQYHRAGMLQHYKRRAASRWLRRLWLLIYNAHCMFCLLTCATHEQHTV